MVTTSGWCAGDYFDPEHRKICIRCNHLAWSEYRRAHPGWLRRMMRRILGEPRGMPIPPSDAP